MRRALAAALALAASCGCVFHIQGPEQVLKPEGEKITALTPAGASLGGEFLGLRGENLVLLRDRRLVEFPLAGLSRVEILGYPTVKVREREKLLFYARYPQGLGEELWAELLRERGQTAFDKGEPTPPPPPKKVPAPEP